MSKVPVKKLNLDEIIKEINELNQKCLTNRAESDYQDNDVRSLIFLLLSIDIQNLLLSVTFSKNLKRIEFYEENGYKTDNIDDEYMENSLYQYISGVSNSYFISIFVQLENYLRLMANHKEIGDFKISVTVQNLITEYGLNEDNSQLWEIVADLRNCMHNGGFFNHNTKTVTYKGTEYKFTKNEPINYGGIPNFIFFTNELIDNLISELNTNSTDDNFIEHNYANLEFESEE
jgi:hypothetical protein